MSERFILSSFARKSFLVVFFGCCLHFGFFHKVKAEEFVITNSPELRAIAEAAYSSSQYQKAIDSWLMIIQQEQSFVSRLELARIQSNIASTFYQIGKYGAAIRYWGKAIEIYRIEDNDKLLGINLTNQARAHLAIGQTLLAEKRLMKAIALGKELKLNSVLAGAYSVYGNLHKNKGNYTKAENFFNKSILVTSSPAAKIVANNNLSQILYSHSQLLLTQANDMEREGIDSRSLKISAQSLKKRALFSAQKAVAISEEENIQSLPSVEAYLQLIFVLKVLKPESTEIQLDYYWQKAEKILSTLPKSTRKVYALINLGKFQDNPVSILIKAQQVAKDLNDYQSASFALGYLGRYYEKIEEYQTALQWTNQARIAASISQDNSSLYRWEWQAGRIHNSTSQTSQAIDAYERAIASLQLVRSELTVAVERQLDFDTEILPVYQELLRILLDDNPTSFQINQAINVRDLLALSELENFFGDYCLELLSSSSEQSSDDNSTGLIYTIVLPEATHIIFKQGLYLKSFQIDVSHTQLDSIVEQWRIDLESRENDNYLFSGRKLYDLLIKPIESELIVNKPETLIFINDGLLRNVPMAALYDGATFLVENYPIGNSLGLNLRLEKTESFESLNNDRALALGLSEETDSWSQLPYVKEEIELLASYIDTKQILNEDFTKENMLGELMEDNFPLVHIATHGHFSGTLSDSFLLTYEGQLSLIDLENILENHQNNFPDNPIQLLTLSACQTATGNKRATLGLSGVAIRSGVSNVVGSLWFVNDSAEKDLIADFYSFLLKEEKSPIEALAMAQVNMIRKKLLHPALWSSLILTLTALEGR